MRSSELIHTGDGMLMLNPGTWGPFSSDDEEEDEVEEEEEEYEDDGEQPVEDAAAEHDERGFMLSKV